MESVLIAFLTIVIAYGPTILFTKWERLPLKKAGVVAGKTTPRKLIIGIFHGITEKGFESTVEMNAWISYLITMLTAIAIFYFSDYHKRETNTDLLP